MSLSIDYLLQESLVRSCTAANYLRFMNEHLNTCSPSERLRLRECYRRVRNREYAKERRTKHGQYYFALFEENSRLRQENEELKRMLAVLAIPILQHEYETVAT